MIWQLKAVQYVWCIEDLGYVMREEIGAVDGSGIIRDIGLGVQLGL